MPEGLLPSKDPAKSLRVDRPLPLCARKWGRILDTSSLKPGDLILVRSAEPDWVAKQISNAQVRGGFAEAHAQWTHVAVYLGDGESICEATFKEQGLFQYGVITRSIHFYCDNKTALRVRRPKDMTDEKRIGIAIGALNRAGARYGLGDIWRFWLAARSGKGFWQGNVRQSIKTSALVCSTLYQDAYNFTLRGDAVRMGSLCTPAHLSTSEDFEAADIPIEWIGIVA